VDREGVRLSGARARVFRKGQEAVDVEPGASLNGLVGWVG
jgi:hypothetical protein